MELLQNALICNGTALSPGGDSVKGAVLEPLSRIIGMKYAGTALSLHIFKGVLHFATRPFSVFGFIVGDLEEIVWCAI